MYRWICTGRDRAPHDIVETVGATVVGQQVGHLHVGAQQCVERPLVLVPIEPSQHRAFGLRVGGTEAGRQFFEKRLAVGVGRQLGVWRRHLAVANAIVDADPLRLQPNIRQVTA